MARDFDGSSDEIALGDLPITEGRANLSIAAWINLDTLGDFESVFSKRADALSGLNFGLSGATLGDNNDLLVVIRNGANNTHGFTTSDLIAADGAWRHVAFAFNGGGALNADKLQIYINGAAQTVTFGAGGMPATTPSNTAVANLGAQVTGTPNFLDGKIAEFAIWQRTLSAAEVAALANRFSPRFFRNSLVCYMPLIRDVVDEYRAASITDDSSVADHPPIIYPAGHNIGRHSDAAAGFFARHYYEHIAGRAA